MTEQEMLNKLEEGRQDSLRFGCTVWSMSNGHEILNAYSETSKETWELLDYWVCSIFEQGIRAEA